MPGPGSRSSLGRRWLSLRLGSRREIEAELDEELETHLAMRVDHLVARGIPLREAIEQARAHFGDFDTAMRELRSSVHTREQRLDRRERWASVRQDLLLTWRLMRRSPRYYLAMLAVLALGVGANAAVFNILQTSLLQPLPYRAPDEVAMLWSEFENEPPGSSGLLGTPRGRGVLTAPQLLAWREEGAALTPEVAGIISWRTDLEPQWDISLEERAERLHGAYVTPNFFSLLGITPLHGRLFQPGDQGESGPLLVLSHELWQRNFGGDPAVVGQSFTMTGGRNPRTQQAFTIIGVLPPAFRFTYPEVTEAWALMTWQEVARRRPTALTFQAVARRGAGVLPAQLDDGLRRFRTAMERPGEQPGDRQVLRAEPIREWVVGEVRPMLILLGGVALLLLLITCVTVANALLARLAERQRELALRASLGAGRARLVRQLLTEGAALAAAGTGAGVLLAVAIDPAMRTLLPGALPEIGGSGLSLPLVAFAATVAGLTTVLAALVPVWIGSGIGTKGDVLRLNAAGSPDRHTVRWRQLLLGVQAATTTLLLVSATLLLVSMERLGRVTLGFDPGEVLTVEMRLLDPRYAESTELHRFQDQLLQRVRAIPGVTEAGVTSAVPFRGVDYRARIGVLGGEQEIPGNVRFVDPGFFEVLEVPLLAGRLPGPGDRTGTPPVMVVSESFAAQAFAGRSPIGEVMDFRGPVEIVGVVGDLRYRALDQEPYPAFYLPAAQFPSDLVCLVVRIDNRRLSVAAAQVALQRAVHEVDPWLPAMRPATVDGIIAETVSGRRFYTVATTSFSLLALLLTVTGMGVVVARIVVERRRELAIRLALGASQAHLVRRAGRDGLLATSWGILFGGTVAWIGAQQLAPFLFETNAHSPVLHGGVALAVALVSVVIAFLVARRIGHLPIAALLTAE